MRISTKVYLIPQHFSWCKDYEVLIPKLVPGSCFASAKNSKGFIWHGSTAHDEDSDQEQRTHLISLLVAKIFKSCF